MGSSNEYLSDKLKSLGVHLGANNPPKPETPKRRGLPIENVIQGCEDETPYGSTFVVQADYPLEYIHGADTLCRPVDAGFLNEWCRVPQRDELRLEDYIFLDTETSGLAGGTGTFAFMVGLGWRIPTGFRLVQLFMRDPGQEEALLATLARIVEPFKAVVTFNGKGYDIPLLNARHVLNGFTSPFPEMGHVDLLPVARKLWRMRLPSRALKDLEVEILNLQRTEEEVPGWMVPELYFDYLHTGNAYPLKGVFYHNAIDILSLAALFNVIGQMLVDPLNGHMPDQIDRVAVAQMYEELGYLEMAFRLYEHSLDQGLPRHIFIQTLQRFAMLHKRQQQWEQALELWKKAVEYDQVDAGVELAKYYEHRQCDYVEALYWTQRATECMGQAELTEAARRSLEDDLQRRTERLVKKGKWS